MLSHGADFTCMQTTSSLCPANAAMNGTVDAIATPEGLRRLEHMPAE